MAVSLSSSYSDLGSLTDQLKFLQGFDYSGQESMEMVNSVIVGERQTFIQNQEHNQNFQVFDQVIDFVDSPPDSKEAWSPDYVKTVMHGPTILESQTIQPATRKRRMEWDSLDVASNIVGPVLDSKVPNLGVSSVVVNTKERPLVERKKSQGRLGWADDIDLDLSSDLSNNGYISEALLAFNTHLTVLKQELPSPTHDNSQKTPRSPQELNRQALSENRQQQQQQQQHQQQQQNNSNGNGGPNENSNGLLEQNGSLGGLQHMLQQQNSFDGGSPTHGENGNSKNEGNDDCRFQYVLAAPTSIATKNNEDTLTYLNQGQSYEIKLKKLGDLSPYRGKILKSVIKICFHERRLQYMEKEQIQQWQASRPGDRIVEVDVPLSYGLCHVSQPLNPNLINTVEVLWDPMKEAGIYIKVNCISTEFTPKKHGGEKGVPFRIQVETYLENGQSLDGIMKPIHAAACQIKVFKLKGADRKHKQDREKIQKRPPCEQEKYQASCECTILIDIPTDSIQPQQPTTTTTCYSPEHVKTVSPILSSSPVHMTKFDVSFNNNNNNNNNSSSVIAAATTTPVAINNVSSSNSNVRMIDQGMLSPQNQNVEMEEFIPYISKDTTPNQLSQWMSYHRLSSYLSTFAQFSGSDLLRMSKEDLIQICGLADGIRMYNSLHAKAIHPRLTLYVSLDATSYHAIYLHAITTKELVKKLFKIPGIFDASNSSGMNGSDNNFNSSWGLQSKYSASGSNLYESSKLCIYINGPNGVHVLVNDEVLNNIKDESLFTLDYQNGKVLMKAVYKNEMN